MDHHRVREDQDRSWTFALLSQIAAAGEPEGNVYEAFGTLAHLEDFRCVGPLTEMVEDVRLPHYVRERASKVVSGFDDITSGDQCRRWWSSGDLLLKAHALRLMERSEADIVTTVAGDDQHPLQALALAAMAFGYDEAQYQPVKVRALGHKTEAVREAAADVLLWDEAVVAEKPLAHAAFDASTPVAKAALNTLQYYPSRSVLRVLADRCSADDDEIRTEAEACFDFVKSSFEEAATFGDNEQVQLLRAWMAPVADLVRWPEMAQQRPTGKPRPQRPRDALDESALRALLEDLDGGWEAKQKTLWQVDWEAFGNAERERLSLVLRSHPDPVVRGIASVPLAVWSRSGDLLALTYDPSSTVQKFAMYELKSVPRDATIAERAWEYVAGAAGIAAREALQTYVAHASQAQATDRLIELSRTDRREIIRTTAISSLAELRARRGVESLTSLLWEPPAVSWAVHISVLDALRTLHISPPPLDELTLVDNLYVVQSAFALRCGT